MRAAGAVEEGLVGLVGPDDVVSLGAIAVTGAIVVIPIVLFDIGG